jgi:tetratricopeptide (TPR) repeat protein
MTQIISYIQKQQKKILILIGIVAVAALMLFGWNYQQGKRNINAQNEMFQAVYKFEAGEYDKALQGDGIHSGFLDIVKNYHFTQAANLANFYAGVCYMHQANYANAVQHLKNFKSNDYLLQARAWSLIGDALVEQKVYPEATKYYLKAAEYKPNESFSPTYLVKAAITYEAQKDYRNALKCYQEIKEKYKKSSLYAEANKQISRLEALL